ncbi:MAG: hypothetical protein SOT41_04855 [Candidatus Faecisoma sp.]|nr:hypothetical protein [Candidatus Faecisoma sp.]
MVEVFVYNMLTLGVGVLNNQTLSFDVIKYLNTILKNTENLGTPA